jgi:hypothetical protein
MPTAVSKVRAAFVIAQKILSLTHFLFTDIKCIIFKFVTNYFFHLSRFLSQLFYFHDMSYATSVTKWMKK